MSPKKHTAVFKILHKYFMICPKDTGHRQVMQLKSKTNS